MDRLLNKAKAIAKSKNIDNWITLNISNAKNKRFSIKSPSGKLINFGLWEFKGKGTFLDHNDTKIRDAWRARHSKILKDGKKAYMDKESPEYYSWNILW
jgi:hypothetical protein